MVKSQKDMTNWANVQFMFSFFGMCVIILSEFELFVSHPTNFIKGTIQSQVRSCLELFGTDN